MTIEWIRREIATDEFTTIANTTAERIFLGEADHSWGEVQAQAIACAARSQMHGIMAGSATHVEHRSPLNGHATLEHPFETEPHALPENAIDQGIYSAFAAAVECVEIGRIGIKKIRYRSVRHFGFPPGRSIQR